MFRLLLFQLAENTFLSSILVLPTVDTIGEIATIGAIARADRLGTVSKIADIG